MTKGSAAALASHNELRCGCQRSVKHMVLAGSRIWIFQKLVQGIRHQISIQRRSIQF